MRDRWKVPEKPQGLGHGHLQDIRNGMALELHLQGLAIVASARAIRAGYGDIGQKEHLDVLRAFPFARFTAATLSVEGEALRAITAHFCLRQLSEEFTHGREDAGVGRRGRPRRAAQRGLVNEDHFAKSRGVFKVIERSRDHACCGRAGEPKRDRACG